MSFDEQLQRAFDTLSDHLRDEMARQLGLVAGELSDAARQANDEAVAATRRDADQALAAAAADRAQAVADAAREAREQAQAEAERDVAARIANATSVAEARGRQEAVLEAAPRLADLQAQLQEAEQRARAAHEESRAALEQAAAAVRVDAADTAPLDRLLAAVRAIDEARSLSAILDALAEAAADGGNRAGIFLLRGGGLRSWRAFGPSGRIVEIGYDEAPLLASAVRQQMLLEGAPPPFSDLSADHRAVAAPIVLAGEPVGVLYVDAGSGPIGRAPAGRAIDLLARHASTALEAMTAFKAARALVDAPLPSASDAADPAESARRYARLLVSEIKLYHETDVLAGRRDRNLATRLASEIDRARKLYEERVPPGVRAANDYFQAELVRTLASGDPSLLGESKA